MAADMPSEEESSPWLIPPDLPPGVNLDLNSIIRHGRLTPEVADQLAKFLVAVQNAKTFEAASCPPRCIQEGCPELVKCTDNSMACPKLRECSGNHPV